MNVVQRFFRRQFVIPFETGYAAFCVYTGIAGICSFGIISVIFEDVLGYKLSLVFNIAHIISGLALYFGIGFNRRNLEAFGVIIIMMSLVVRSVVVFYNAGLSYTVVNTYVFAIIFLISAAVRLHSLVTGITIIETRPTTIKLQ